MIRKNINESQCIFFSLTLKDIAFFLGAPSQLPGAGLVPIIIIQDTNNLQDTCFSLYEACSED